MTRTEARGLKAVLVLLLSCLHASAWVTPGLVHQGSCSSQVKRQRWRQSDTQMELVQLRTSTFPAGKGHGDLGRLSFAYETKYHLQDAAVV